MKKLLPYLVSAAVICAVYYFYFQVPATQTGQADQPTQKALIVGTSADYPPYAQIDLATGQIVGFEIDVVNEIAQRLGKEVVIKDMPFDTLIVQLMAGQIDVIAAGIAPSEERSKTVLFSHPYIENDVNVVVSKKDTAPINSIEDLYGKPIAVNIGYMAETFLSQYPQISLVRLKSPADGFIALQSNNVQGFGIAQSIVHKFLENQADRDNYQLFVLPAPADGCALAFEKNNTELKSEIDPIINAMIEDGTMLIIKKKWGFES